jgi:hypothetical protein
MGSTSETGTAKQVDVDDDGHLQVDVLSNVGSGSEYVDDGDWTALTSEHTLVGGIYQSTPGTITDGDTGPLRVDENGHVITSPHAESVAFADNVSNTQPVWVDESGDLVPEATFGFVYDGSTWDRQRGDSTNGTLVNLGSNNDVSVAGTVTVTDDGSFTLAANSGVDIGDVDVTSVIPGTGATNLGKAIDDVVGSTDTGIAVLAKHLEDQVHLTTADGDYDVISMDSLGSVHVNSEAHHIFDNLNVTTGWAAFGNDTLNLATTTIHSIGTAALTFDKVDGAANTVFAGIEKTITSVDLGDISPHDILQTMVYVSSIADINYVFCRVGTDSSNYNEWRIDGENLTSGTFDVLAFVLGDTSHAGSTGAGWDPSAVTYIALGIAFDAQNNTLSGIIFDQFSYHTNQHTTTSITAEVSSQVASPNVRLNGYGGSTDTNTGNASNNTLRTVLATDQPTVAVDGGVAHDAADSENPVKIGGKATDWDPDSDAEQGPSDVAASDRTDGAFDRQGAFVERVNARYHAPDNVSTTYDDDPTTATSTAIECHKYRYCTIAYELDESGTATDIQIFVEVSLDGTNFTVLTNDALGSLIYTDTNIGTGLEESYSFPIAANDIRIRVVATGTDASNTFTITNFMIYLRN